MTNTTPLAPSGRPHAQEPARKRSNVILWLWLSFSLVATVCFLLTWAIVSATALAIFVAWAPFLIGICLLVTAGVFAMIAIISLICNPSGKSPILSVLCVLVGAGSVWGLHKAASAMWAGAKTTVLVGGLLLAMSPWGRIAVLAWAELEEKERAEMKSSLKPKWKMIRVEYTGANPPESPKSISFVFTNTGPHAIVMAEGDLNVWNSMEHAQIDLPMKPKAALKPGGSIRLNFPLNEQGRQVFNIIQGIASDGDQPAGSATQPAGGEFHLRYRLSRLIDRKGKIFEIRSGNIEPSKFASAYDFKRGLTNPEWGLITVKYLGMQTQAHPGRAAFSLTTPHDHSVTGLKGKLNVIDIEAGHVAKDVELSFKPALSPRDSVVFALDAGKESELADKIITARTAYDRAVGNDEQTSHIVRFQLAEMKTVGGKTHTINWLGEFK